MARFILLACCWLIVPVFLSAQDSADLAAVREGRWPSADVTVVSFDTNGRFLGAPVISIFEDAGDKKDLAPKFHGGAAEGVPFGTYRIKAYLTGYRSDEKYVWVYQRHVTVVVGLVIGGVADTVLPPTLRGRVVGALSFSRTFVRLTSVYSNDSMDSSIGADGGFEMCGMAEGKYLLLVIGEAGVLASRPITFPYKSPPLEISLERNAAVKEEAPPQSPSPP